MAYKKGIIALFFALCIASLLYFSLNKDRELTPSTVSVNTSNDTVLMAKMPEPQRLFGIVIDSLQIVEDKIRRDQNLSSILGRFNISMKKIEAIAKTSKEIFDVRRLRMHKPYTLFVKPDSTPTHFIYEPNPFEYFVFELEDSGKVYRTEREIVLKEQTISGIINTSLYVDMIEQNGSPQLVDALADVFGWQIDFFKIQKGDKYKVIFQEKIIDGKSVGIGDLIGAHFEHFGNDYFAINYNQGKGEDFFDEEGNSLRKAFLRAPVEHSRITSRYSGNRFHPVQKRWKAHLGTDYAAPRGTPIRATGDGIVTDARFKKYNGNYVKIKHNGTYTTQYLHMSSIGKGMKPGVKVKQGQTIGYVGSTGLATGNHVCYRFWKNGSQVDAMKVNIPPSEPIDPENLVAYSKVRDLIISKLDSIIIHSEEGPVLAKNLN